MSSQRTADRQNSFILRQGRKIPGFLLIFAVVTSLLSNSQVRADLSLNTLPPISAELSIDSSLPGPQAEGASSPALQFPFVPEAHLTTGSLCHERDPDFEQPRYAEKIPFCRRNVSRDTKTEIYEAYGVSHHCRREYTVDHFIPLSIGGSNQPANLWPEHKSIKALRANLENELFQRISKGEISQAEAIRVIREAKLNPTVTSASDFKFCR